MSTRDVAYNIFQQLTDDELQGFILIFSKLHPQIDNPPKQSSAFERLQSMIRPGTHDIDEKKELEQYRKEKYGI